MSSVVALETEIVASRFDAKTRMCSYTIEREGKRWTVSLPLEAFAKHKQKQLKRNFLANALLMAMRGKSDAA